MKNEKTKLIMWVVIALVIGVIIGAFLVAPMTTTGDAKKMVGVDQGVGNLDFFVDGTNVHYWPCCCDGSDEPGCPEDCICKTIATGGGVPKTTIYAPVQ